MSQIRFPCALMRPRSSAAAWALALGIVSGTLAGGVLGSVGAQAQVMAPQNEGGDSEGMQAGQGEDEMLLSKGKSKGRTKRVKIAPYIELNQIVTAQLSGGSDVLTYTQAVAGVDAQYVGRNSGLGASIRYERQFGWGKRAGDGDQISGLVNGHVVLAPGVMVQAGGLATQMNGSTGGGFLGTSLASDKSRSTVYSAYVEPSVRRKVGDLDVAASYRLGYTTVESSNRFDDERFGQRYNSFNDSVSQTAKASAGFAPGTVLPVGLGAQTTYYQEDISNLDQRVRNFDARALVTVPVSRTVQVVGSVGYEDVEVSHRDAVIGENGAPLIDKHGHYVSDTSKPRQLAYDVSGLVWDVAVIWRPSRRTMLSANVGRRYGSMSFGGQLAYAPSDRSSLNIRVYDTLSGFGGQLNNSLVQLPEDFEVVRDPITGELRGCVVSMDGDNCLTNALGSNRSSVFRARGISLSYAHKIGRLDAGIGLGYDRRKYVGASGTVLAASDGMVDESYWVMAYVGGPFNAKSGWSANVYANWIDSSDRYFTGSSSYGGSASYYYLITPRLRGTMALGLYGQSYAAPQIDDLWTASALAGLRYSF